MAHEMGARGLTFRQQVSVSVPYKGRDCGRGFRADFIVEDQLLVELKTATILLPVHQRQVLTYLRALKLRQGLLMNFNGVRLIDGLRSVLLP